MSTTATVTVTPQEKIPQEQYKEFATTRINKDIELKGTDKSTPASFPNYLPVWDNEKGNK